MYLDICLLPPISCIIKHLHQLVSFKMLQEENQSGDEKVTVATNTCSYSKQGAQLMVVMVVMLLVMMGLVAVVVMGQQILAFMQEKSSLAALGASGFSFGAGGGVGISMIATSR